MIKPVSINNRIGIDPIKVPRQNSASFTGFVKPSFVKPKRVPRFIRNGNFTKLIKEEMPKFFEKSKKIAGKVFKKIADKTSKVKAFIANSVDDVMRFISKKTKNMTNVTADAGRKSRTLKNIVAGGSATGGIIGGVAIANSDD